MICEGWADGSGGGKNGVQAMSHSSASDALRCGARFCVAQACQAAGLVAFITRVYDLTSFY